MRTTKIVVWAGAVAMATVQLSAAEGKTLAAEALGTPSELTLLSDSMQMYSLEEAVIEGERENRHNLAPNTVSTLSAGQIQTLEVTSVSGLSALMPNLFIPEYGSRQTRPVSIRGVMSKVKGSAVGYYIDDMPRFEISSLDMDMIDVKSIEVMRGPQGTLYGRNSLGGLISVHTFDPFEYQGTRLRLSYGNYNRQNIQASNYTKINSQVGISLSGYYQHHDGFFDNKHKDEKADPQNLYGGKLGFYWRPTERWSLRALALVDVVDQEGYPYAPYDSEQDKVGDVSYNAPSDYNRVMVNAGLKVHYQGDNFSFNSQTTFEHIDDNQHVDQDFTPNDLYRVGNGLKSDVVCQEFTLKSENEARLQWILGQSTFYQTFDQDLLTQYVAQGMTDHTDFHAPVTGTALYGQFSYDLGLGLSATLGARWHYEYGEVRHTSTRKMGEKAADPKVIRDEMRSSTFIPKFALLWQMANQNSLYASVSRGFKAGGFNITMTDDSEHDYKPEQNWNYEVGTKWSALDRRLSGELSLFYIDWRDQHVNRTVPGVGNIVSNAGHSDSKGMEASLKVRPLENLLLQGNYGYTYARFLDYKKSETVNYSGNMLPLVPRHTLSLIGSYVLTPTRGLDRIVLSANMTGVGKLYWLEDNQQVQSFYSLLGAKVAFVKGHYAIELWGKNLTNQDYLSYYFMAPAKYAQQGEPTTLGVTLNINL